MELLSEQFSEEKKSEYDLKVSSAEIFEADTRANIDIQVATAKRYRRNLPSVLENILFLSTHEKETADSCFYSLKRDGKVVRGASIRLAEIIANCYGNLRASARIVANDGRTITAQGIAWDLENNVAYSIEVKRSITKKDGQPYSEDMVVVTSNACCSIALRNAIFKCVPLSITNSVQEKIRAVVLGKESDFQTVRVNAVRYFENQGVPLKTILSLFERKVIDDLTRDDVFDLRGIATAIKDGDTTLDLAFQLPSKANAVGKATKMLSIPVNDEIDESGLYQTTPIEYNSPNKVIINDVAKKEVLKKSNGNVKVLTVNKEQEVVFGEKEVSKDEFQLDETNFKAEITVQDDSANFVENRVEIPVLEEPKVVKKKYKPKDKEKKVNSEGFKHIENKNSLF